MKKVVMKLPRWERGRQGTGYDKMLLLTGKWPLPFDVYLLRYRVGDHIPLHTDPNEGGDHHRLNIVLKRARRGGNFGCQYAEHIKINGRVVLFRPDKHAHWVSPVREGSRYVLSIGWLRRVK